MQDNKSKITERDIQDWFKTRLVELLEIEPNDIDIKLPFDSYNLDSNMAVGLTSDLEDWLGTDLEPTVLYEHPTIEKISRYLTAASQEKE